ncbi:NADP-dependent oxidoreductase [Gordonia sp. HY285]|uniref:NADP-dependent oxidoreductase n=1 Tax=Gordonia liuliyuniae TaxID=2911517 RepID=A0ABS9ITQ7_9ACTN|nr:NADP-dependent oxidoreductase [Gordonia liuliyuniae]MCF8588959.1 NADP-dependent oxidoreductase [Gordonia liuliyuniae]MCF8609160.1 NADP-dependent oxidoreductase [Gordonia liuliyuniae]
MTGPHDGREWVLRSRPHGRPQNSDVELVASRTADLADGAVRVRNLVMSVEPYMRGRMGGESTYAEPYPIGEPLRAPTVGRVIESADSTVPVGTLVLHDYGWREYSSVPVSECRVLGDDRIDPAAYLGVLGIPGMTAWVGLDRIAQVRAGDVVFVSSAAGAVGSTAVQFAKLRGATVIASAGSPEKVELARDLGADAAFDYHGGEVGRLLRSALAEIGAGGIDVYFDNVGGEHLEAAIRVLNDHARIALCGMISIYNSATPLPGPSNLIKLVWRRARMEGFLLRDHLAARDEFEQQMSGWVRTGRIRGVHTAFDGGVAGAWDAFLGMLDGRATGKAIVPLSAGDCL